MSRAKHRETMTRFMRKKMREAGSWDRIIKSAEQNPKNPVAKYLLDREKEHTPDLKVVLRKKPKKDAE